MNHNRRLEKTIDPWLQHRYQLKQLPDRQAIIELQLQALRETITWVKQESAFYKQTLADIEPQQLTDLQAIEKLPFTTPEQLAQNPEGFWCAPGRELVRIVSLNTSGTTGPKKRIAVTESDLERTIDYFHAGMRLLVDASDRVLNLFPSQTPDSLGDLLNRATMRVGCQVMTPASPAEEQKQASCITGLPGQIAELAAACQKPERPTDVSSVLLSADFVSRASVRSILKAWPGCRIYEHYGMTEMGFGGAVSCFVGTGYHVRETDLLIEIIDPKTGQTLPDGEFGEIVFTSLSSRGTPLIRYRSGDYSRWLTRACPCGSVLRRLDRVGRREQTKGSRS
ncbi:MAG TPA: phenylacetate--CoA ligase family protein [Clostridiales bacterium]|jgi:phenylacetate-coenzyme A ligase PaaK-like adenylate-forming protein|nr:phenylacetate--CoA ligase family protein [Clostridiales bacterium]